MIKKIFLGVTLAFFFLFLNSCHSFSKKYSKSCSHHSKEKHSKSCCSHSKEKHSKEEHSKKCCSKKKSCCPLSGLSGKASVKAVKGDRPTGFVFFNKVPHRKGFVRVTAKIENLKPNQKFGFHVHEFGDCSNQALNAGGHLISYHKHSKSFFKKKRKKSQHGGPKDLNKHLGDLGNLSSNAKGEASYDEVLKGHFKRFLGRSVIIHEKEDDLKTQPTGNSGARIACGIIGLNLADSSEE